MFETDTSLHDIQDRLRDEIRRTRQRMVVTNALMIAASACAVVLYWYLF